MYRKVLNELINWKNDPCRKPLILMGARQVGKNWILQEFGKKHYDDYLYVNSPQPIPSKLFPLDIGLSGAMVNAPAASILIGDDIFTEYKGSFTEAYVLEQMITTLKTPIYYHSRQDSTLKLDFTVEGRYVYPIEVKAETNLRAKSLSTILNENPTLKGIRFSMAPCKEQERTVNVPLPLVEPYMETI